jgi:hypothetical protein
MNAYNFVKDILPENIIWDIISNSNNPVLNDEEDLINVIEEKPWEFSDIILKYAPKWAEKIFEKI